MINLQDESRAGLDRKTAYSPVVSLDNYKQWELHAQDILTLEGPFEQSIELSTSDRTPLGTHICGVRHFVRQLNNDYAAQIGCQLGRTRQTKAKLVKGIAVVYEKNADQSWATRLNINVHRRDSISGIGIDPYMIQGALNDTNQHLVHDLYQCEIHEGIRHWDWSGMRPVMLLGIEGWLLNLRLFSNWKYVIAADGGVP